MAAQAPHGDHATFEVAPFTDDGKTFDVYRKGTGPAVIVLTEMPGLAPKVFGFADRVADAGFSVVLPDLYGTVGKNPFSGSMIKDAVYGASSMVSGCVSRDFSTYALDRTSPIAVWLRALARAEHERCGGAGVGAVGMCFSGGFALAMATDPAVVAPIMSQPALPLPFTKKHRRAIDVSSADLDTILGRCSAAGLKVLGLQFEGDPFSPTERFAFLKERLGDGFISVELDQADGNSDLLANPLVSSHHSVLTHSLVDEPGTATRDALEQVLSFLRDRLAPA